MEGRTESVILRNLFYNEDYIRKVVPFILPEYFELEEEKELFGLIVFFFLKYDKLPTAEALILNLKSLHNIPQDVTDKVVDNIERLIDSFDQVADQQWLMDITERWCQERAIYLALMESISIADGQDEKKDKGSIPDILASALSVSFDNHIGHDYLADYEERYESYHRKEDKIPFDLEYFDKITKGGLPN